MSDTLRCAAACGRELDPEDMVTVGGVPVCEPCAASIAKAEERRESIDAALDAISSVARDGFVTVTIELGRGIPRRRVTARYMRIGELDAAAEVYSGDGHVARELRGFAAILAKLPPLEAT